MGKVVNGAITFHPFNPVGHFSGDKILKYVTDKNRSNKALTKWGHDS